MDIKVGKVDRISRIDKTTAYKTEDIKYRELYYQKGLMDKEPRIDQHKIPAKYRRYYLKGLEDGKK